ncbi:hypothetical protein ACFYVL_22075 [Streptomyces sp. NPDC004111]|uniref:hypothetical protein n=1 Tax=Streptomyces sp. NPDC004111 TaxID=3364690 RepID=UPI003692CA0A
MTHAAKGVRAGVLGMAGALACTSLVACGSGTGKEPGSTGSSGAANGAGQSSGAADGGTAAVRSASDRTTDAGTARMVLRTQVTTQGKTVSADGQGVIDLKNGTSTMTLSAEGEKIEQRVVDQVLYQKLPPGAREGVPGKKPWIKMDLRKLGAQTGGTNPSAGDPAANTAFARGVMDKDVHKVGTEKIGDANTTHYKVKVDVAKLKGGAELRKVVGPTLPMDLWIDDQGRIRRQQVDMTMTPPKGQGADSSTPKKITSRTVFELSDFGTKVTAEAPPAAETADMTAKAAQQAQQGKQQG